MYMNDGNKTKINLRNKSVFITGVAGFIGSNLAKRLLSTVEGVKVVGLDNMNHYYDVRLKEARLNELEQFDNFSFVKGNLADKAMIESIFEQYKPEIVVNLGAQAGVRYSITNPDAYVEANLIGFYNILEACRHSYDEGHTPVEHLVYKILNVLLKNKGFDTIARKNMNRKQTGRYDAYNLTYGNRPELFGAGSPTYSGGTTGSIGTGGGTGGSGGGFKYDIPSEALSDEKFARMIEEAEKYLGMPYVWGGSSPSTSFDCSGFVCWVINNSGNGWSVGRTTANGLRGKCSYVSPADAQPGDLIFFEKTYNTVGASHVGIYVGNGMMIHCGDPISYTSINSTYWQSHFLGFGRIN